MAMMGLILLSVFGVNYASRSGCDKDQSGGSSRQCLIARTTVQLSTVSKRPVDLCTYVGLEAGRLCNNWQRS